MSNPTALWHGLRIVESPHLTKSVNRVVPRSFRERWFSRPWCPWVREKTVTVQEPDPQCYVMGNTVVMHPSAARALKEQSRHV